MDEKRIVEYIPILGKVTVNFSQISFKIFKHFDEINEFDRQKNINHLGLISHAFPSLSHSRYDYLILQCVLSELIEKNFRGTTSAQGDITIDKRKYRGNEIIKSWIQLSNFGHCYNTIGDEKTLLSLSLKKRRFFSYLTSKIKDNELKEWAENILKRMDYVNFHHIISIYRIYNSLKRKLDVQAEFIRFYKLLLLPTTKHPEINQLKLSQLKATYRNIRNLAIISLDARDSPLPIRLDTLSTIVSFDFYKDKFQGFKLSKLFNPLLNLLYENLYLAKESQTRQRDYEILAFNDIENSSDYKSIISKALSKGLIAVPKKAKIKHLLRIKYTLRKGEKMSSLFEKATKLNIDKVHYFSIDFNKLTKQAVIDFYISKDSNYNLLPKLLFEYSKFSQQLYSDTTSSIESHQHVTKILNNNLCLTDEEKTSIEKELNRFSSSLSRQLVYDKSAEIYKDLLWVFLKLHLKDHFYFDVDTIQEKYYGVKFSESEDYLTDEVNKKIKSETDKDRIHELNHILKATKRKFNGITIACFERITIYDYSLAPSKRKVTDIDSVILKFNGTQIILELNETKNTKNCISQAKKDLKKYFIRVLSKSTKYRTVAVKEYGAKIVIKYSI